MSGILLLVLPQHFWYNRILEYKMRKHLETKEEKQVRKLADILSDLRLDLEMVGYYLAMNVSSVVYNRFQIISETAKEVKEKDYDR
jgi:hypothetical protein